jgi:IS5 family transposase
MRPRERRESGEQDLFRSRLDQIIAMSHPLVVSGVTTAHFAGDRPVA